MNPHEFYIKVKEEIVSITLHQLPPSITQKNVQNDFSSHSEKQEIWAPLIEKAWAKVHGSYQKTVDCLPSFAALHFTGAPASHLSSDDAKFY